MTDVIIEESAVETVVEPVVETKQDISHENLLKIIDGVHSLGVFYRVTFVKRKDGKTAKMICRGGVKKGLKKKDGDSPEPRKSFDPKVYDLMTTYAIDRDGWRSFGKRQGEIVSAKICGVEYTVK